MQVRPVTQLSSNKNLFFIASQPGLALQKPEVWSFDYGELQGVLFSSNLYRGQARITQKTTYMLPV